MQTKKIEIQGDNEIQYQVFYGAKAIDDLRMAILELHTSQLAGSKDEWVIKQQQKYWRDRWLNVTQSVAKQLNGVQGSRAVIFSFFSVDPTFVSSNIAYWNMLYLISSEFDTADIPDNAKLMGCDYHGGDQQSLQIVLCYFKNLIKSVPWAKVGATIPSALVSGSSPSFGDKIGQHRGP